MPTIYPLTFRADSVRRPRRSVVRFGEETPAKENPPKAQKRPSLFQELLSGINPIYSFAYLSGFLATGDMEASTLTTVAAALLGERGIKPALSNRKMRKEKQKAFDKPDVRKVYKTLQAQLQKEADTVLKEEIAVGRLPKGTKLKLRFRNNWDGLKPTLWVGIRNAKNQATTKEIVQTVENKLQPLAMELDRLPLHLPRSAMIDLTLPKK